MVTSIQEMQWVLRAQCSDREALEMLLRSVQPSLRRYLDRHRRRLIVGLGVTAVLLLLTFVTGARAARAGTGAVQAILAHFMMLVIWMTALTLVVVIQITVMTKRTLRAIELASKK